MDEALRCWISFLLRQLYRRFSSSIHCAISISASLVRRFMPPASSNLIHLFVSSYGESSRRGIYSCESTTTNRSQMQFFPTCYLMGGPSGSSDSSPCQRFASLEHLRSTDVGDSPSTAHNMFCAVAAAPTDCGHLAFRRFTNFFFSCVHEALGSNHLYIGADRALKQWMYMRTFFERSEFLANVLLNLPHGATVPLNIVRPPQKFDVQSYIDDLIGDSSVLPQSESPSPAI